MVEPIDEPDQMHAGLHGRPLWYLAAAWWITLLVLVAMALGAWDAHQRFARFTQRALRVQELRGQITHLDELLTMSARMAAATGDLRWETRYNDAVDPLTDAIEEARALVPGAAGTAKTDAANQQLVAMETQAFQLVHAGKTDEALAVLLGTAYDTQKDAYAAGLDQLGLALAGRVDSERRAQHRRATTLIIGATVVIPLLVLGWFWVHRVLRRWRRRLTEELSRRHGLESTVASSTHEVTSAAAQIAASAQQQEQTVSAFRASTSRAAGAAQEVASTVQGLTRSVDEVNDLARQTSERAATGEARLAELDETMRQIAEATRHLGTKIDAIRDAAGRINLATSTMVKVVDQTQLLSVNSAIEAEQAGNHAGGFHVVSQEIRRLAEETARATLDIESIVQRIHDRVGDGVAEVQHFEQQVEQSFDRVRQIAHELHAIAIDVTGLSHRFGGIRDAVSEQAAGADEIHTAIEQLSSGAEEIFASSSEFTRVTLQLDRVGRTLQDQVASFDGYGVAAD